MVPADLAAAALVALFGAASTRSLPAAAVDSDRVGETSLAAGLIRASAERGWLRALAELSGDATVLEQARQRLAGAPAGVTIRWPALAIVVVLVVWCGFSRSRRCR